MKISRSTCLSTQWSLQKPRRRSSVPACRDSARRHDQSSIAQWPVTWLVSSRLLRNEHDRSFLSTRLDCPQSLTYITTRQRSVCAEVQASRAPCETDAWTSRCKASKVLLIHSESDSSLEGSCCGDIRQTLRDCWRNLRETQRLLAHPSHGEGRGRHFYP